MRYFLTLAYNGQPFCGWQRQPREISVQETLENALSTLLREPILVTGCGRTDTGVHARHYVAHFDAILPLPDRFLSSLNSLLPKSIAVYHVQVVPPTAHARFDAYKRSYEYHLSYRKDPFGNGLVWFYPQASRMDRAKLQEVADLLPQYDSFLPFCKTHSGVEHYRCQLESAHWEWRASQELLVFHISANRFLRGMVRLIVGACVQTALGKLQVDQVREALEQQMPLPKNLSVPPDGLYLTDIRYPYKID